MKKHNLHPAGRYGDLPTNASSLAQAFFSRDVCAMSERLGENRQQFTDAKLQKAYKDPSTC